MKSCSLHLPLLTPSWEPLRDEGTSVANTTSAVEGPRFTSLPLVTDSAKNRYILYLAKIL